MQVVVTGGTGFVGTALVHALTVRGDDVVVLTRGHAHPAPHACRECKKGGRAKFVTWTPQDEGPWQKALDGVDAVVHLTGAGVVDERWTDERKDELRASRIRSTELVAQAIAQAAAPPKVLLSGSAIGYYGTETGDRVVTEADPVGHDFLATLVKDWESAASGANVRTCFPRLGVVLGRGGGMLAKVAPLFKAFVGGPLGTGRQYLPWIHLGDAVHALLHLMDTATLEGAFNVTAPEPVTMNEFSKTLGAALHRPAVLRVPELAVKAVMGESACAVLTGQRAIPARLVETGFAFVFPELDSALADLA